MHQLTGPTTPVLRLGERFVVDRRLLRPGAVVESVDVGRPERPPVRLHVLDTRETEGIETALEAWGIARDAGLPVAAHVETIRIDGLTCVAVDRLEVGPPNGSAARAAALAEATILVPALAERGVRVDRIASSSIGVGRDGRLAFADPPLGSPDGTAPPPPLAEQTRIALAGLTAWSGAEPLPVVAVPGHDVDTEALPTIGGPRPRSARRGSRRAPIVGRASTSADAPWLDRDRLGEIARGRLVVRAALGLIALTIVLLALGSRGGSSTARPLAVANGAGPPAASVAAPPVSTTGSTAAKASPAPVAPKRVGSSARGRPKPSTTDPSRRRKAGVAVPVAGSSPHEAGPTRAQKAERRRGHAPAWRPTSKKPPRAVPRSATPTTPAAPEAPATTSGGRGGDPFGTL